jgi:hypothetical protein
MKHVISSCPQGVEIGFPGFSTATGTDADGVIYVEEVDGKLTVYIWSDINQEDPTHVIPLAGAANALRVE